MTTRSGVSMTTRSGVSMLYQTVSRLPGTSWNHLSAYGDTLAVCQRFQAHMQAIGFECEIVPAQPGTLPYPDEPEQEDRNAPLRGMEQADA